MEQWEKNLTGRQKSNLKRVKEGPYYLILLKAGFTPFTKEWRRQHQMRFKKDQYKTITPEALKKKREQRRKSYHANILVAREKTKILKRRERERRKDEINENQKERYRKNRVVEASKQRLRRWNREPHRAVRAYTDLYLQGLLTDERYLEHINDYVERAKQLSRRKSREGKGRRAGDGSTGSDLRSETERARPGTNSPS